MRAKANVPSGSDEELNQPTSSLPIMWGKNTLLFVLTTVLRYFCSLQPNITNRIEQDGRLSLKVWTLGNCSYQDPEFCVISDSVQIAGNNQSGVEQHKILIIVGHQVRMVAEAVGCYSMYVPVFFLTNMPFPSPRASPISVTWLKRNRTGKLLIVQGLCSANCVDS